MRNIYRSLLLILTAATQKELARYVAYLKAENKILRSRLPARVEGYRPTMLDDTSWYEPYIETFTSEKLAWASTTARHSYPTYPAMEEYPALIAGYQATLVA